MFNTPILLIAWRRPEHLAKVIDVIRKVQPNKVFVAVDGPRLGDEFKQERILVEETKKVIDSNINWVCQVNKLYREENLGCAVGVSSAITWFFEHVAAGIILEDDIIADLSFFSFCELMLHKFEENNKIFQITGVNSIAKKGRCKSKKIVFSRYASVWGWATWRDRWEQFTLDVSEVDVRKLKDNKFNSLTYSNSEIQLHNQNFLDAINNRVSSWAYYWKFLMFDKSALTIVPPVNLIENIGFDELSTHTYKNSLNLKRDSVEFPLIIPKKIIGNFLFDCILGVTRYKRYNSIVRLWKKI